MEPHFGRLVCRERKALFAYSGPALEKNGVRQAVLFGSYSKGTATPRSDVDILVDSRLRGLAFFWLLEDMASFLETPVDLLDVRQIDSGSRIDRVIRENGVRIWTIKTTGSCDSLRSAWRRYCDIARTAPPLPTFRQPIGRAGAKTPLPSSQRRSLPLPFPCKLRKGSCALRCLVVY